MSIKLPKREVSLDRFAFIMAFRANKDKFLEEEYIEEIIAQVQSSLYDYPEGKK